MPARRPAARFTARRRTTSALAVFTRSASPGRTKTRLIPLLGAQGAAGLHAALVCDTLRKVDSLPPAIARYVFLACPRRQAGPALASLPPQFRLLRQRGLDLGQRLQNAFRILLRHYSRLVVIGTDSPLLPPQALREAFAELQVCDAVLGPCRDGGYYLIGLRRLDAGLFQGVGWSTAHAFRDTLSNLLRRGYSCSVLEPCGDVDRPADVVQLKAALRRESSARRLAPATWKYLQLRGEVGMESAPSYRGQAAASK
ncbi:MAG: TIGR04282 family arsenosugar biosynthesis glycosyltransferase [Terriglobia bacterium]